jgi:hypothetical protein
MGYTVTSSRRRIAMAALLGLATSGGLIRYYAPNPSTLRDVGTLLLVLWLPAVGNLIAFFIQKIPRSVPPATDFAQGAAFAPQLRVELESIGATRDLLAAADQATSRCTLLVGRRGFTARLHEPVVAAVAVIGPQALDIELLHPKAALPHLKPGTQFHLLAGTTAIAKGRVLP